MIKTNSQGQLKVVFRLAPGNVPAVEAMWADKVSENLVRLDNVPVFAYHVSYEDILLVEMVSDDERPYFVRVVKRSKNWTYRLTMLAPFLRLTRQQREAWLFLMTPSASHWNAAYGRYYSFNVPDSMNRDALEEVIDDGERSALWESEVSSGPDLDEV